MKGWTPFFFGILLGILISIFIFRSTACAGEVDVQHRVVTILQEHGYKVAADDLPAVLLTDESETPEIAGHASITFKGVVYLNRHRPEACRESDTAHQVGHYLLGKYYGLAWKESEPLVRAIDSIINAEPYRPGCNAKD